MKFVQVFLAFSCLFAVFVNASIRRSPKTLCHCPSEEKLKKLRAIISVRNFNPYSAFSSHLNFFRNVDGAHEDLLKELRKLTVAQLKNFVKNDYQIPSDVDKKDQVHKTYKALEGYNQKGYITPTIKSYLEGPVRDQPLTDHFAFLELDKKEFELLFKIAHQFQDSFVAYIHYLLKEPNPCPSDRKTTTTTKTKPTKDCEKDANGECKKDGKPEKDGSKDDKQAEGTGATTNASSTAATTSSSARSLVTSQPLTFMMFMALFVMVSSLSFF